MTQQTSRGLQPCNPRHWQAHIKALKESGLSRAEYSRQYNLSYHSLTYWHKKLSKSNKGKVSLVPVTAIHGMKRKSMSSDQAQLKVILPGKFAIEVGDNFSPATLDKLLTVLGGR